VNPAKKLWESLEKLYTDSNNPTILEIVFVIFVYLISYIILVEKFSSLISAKIDVVYKIIISALLLLTIITITLLIRKLRLFRAQIFERNKFVEYVANKYDPKYTISFFSETHEIHENGDSSYRREVTLEYANAIVPWYEMYLGSTNNIPQENDLQIKVINNNVDHVPLANLPYKREDFKTHIAIILNPVLSPENIKTGFILTKKWKKIWTDLVEHYDDEGSINVRFFTRRLELKFIAPKNFEFTKYEVKPKIGHWKLDYDNNDRHSLAFIAEKVRPDLYSYKLSVRSKN
jgi:hypothetical protein